jgi:hypothetical protein
MESPGGVADTGEEESEQQEDQHVVTGRGHALILSKWIDRELWPV